MEAKLGVAGVNTFFTEPTAGWKLGWKHLGEPDMARELRETRGYAPLEGSRRERLYI